jgi:hypothetical protein
LELLSLLVLDMIEVLPPLGKYKYDTWRILSLKCYIDNFVRLWSYITNDNGSPSFYVLDSVLRPVAGVELPKKVFTSRVR